MGRRRRRGGEFGTFYAYNSTFSLTTGAQTGAGGLSPLTLATAYTCGRCKLGNQTYMT